MGVTDQTDKATLVTGTLEGQGQIVDCVVSVIEKTFHGSITHTVTTRSDVHKAPDGLPAGRYILRYVGKAATVIHDGDGGWRITT